MADFVPSQKYASDFNKAKKYENGDAVQAETVNNLIEGQLFVQGIATNQPKVVEDNTDGSPTVYFENKDGLQRFVFRNIRGIDGKPGAKGDNGNIMRFTDSSLGTLSEIGTTLNISRDNLLNSTDVAQGDVVLDTHYTQGEEYYICIWEVTQVSSTAQGVVISLRGMGYVTSSKGGTVKIEVDNALSETSENPVQNKVVTIALNTKVPTTTTVNGHPLSSNVTVTKNDIGLGEVANESPATIRAGLTDTNVKNALGYTPTSPSDLAELNENLSLRISTLDEDITDIKTGETVVNKAENDSNGNKIINTYATKSEANARAKTIEYSWESIGADGINPFKLNLTLKDANGNQLSTTQIDFPLEQMVVDAEYDKVNKQLILKLPDTQFPVPVSDIFEGLATKTELDDTNKTVNNLSTEVSGYSRRITDAESNIGQLQDEKLDKSGGKIYNPNSTTDAPFNIRANNDGCYLGFYDKTDNAKGFLGFSTSGVPQVAIANVGVFDLIHSNNIGSQNVNSAKYLITPNEYGIRTDEYGNFRQITTTSGACWHVDDSNGTSRFSVYFDGSGARVGTNEVLHAGNYETYIRNYMNKTILEQPY